MLFSGFLELHNCEIVGLVLTQGCKFKFLGLLVSNVLFEKQGFGLRVSI